MISENTALRNCDRSSFFPTKHKQKIFLHWNFTELRSFFVFLLQCTHPQLRDAGVSEHLGSDCGVGVKVYSVLTPSLETPESVNILALTVGLG
jgi:hypothetical protein